MRKIVEYRPCLKIVNLDALSKGAGAKFLECIEGENGALVAKQWRRSIPMQRYEILVRFA